MGGRNRRALRAVRRRWLLLGAIAMFMLALVGAGVAQRLASARESRALPPTALAPPDRF